MSLTGSREEHSNLDKLTETGTGRRCAVRRVACGEGAVDVGEVYLWRGNLQGKARSTSPGAAIMFIHMSSHVRSDGTLANLRAYTFVPSNWRVHKAGWY